ncbi:MAG: hypothetical protein WCF54_00675 [Terracidiphilus sp.]
MLGAQKEVRTMRLARTFECKAEKEGQFKNALQNARQNLVCG